MIGRRLRGPARYSDIKINSCYYLGCQDRVKPTREVEFQKQDEVSYFRSVDIYKPDIGPLRSVEDSEDVMRN